MKPQIMCAMLHIVRHPFSRMARLNLYICPLCALPFMAAEVQTITGEVIEYEHR